MAAAETPELSTITGQMTLNSVELSFIGLGGHELMALQMNPQSSLAELHTTVAKSLPSGTTRSMLQLAFGQQIVPDDPDRCFAELLEPGAERAVLLFVVRDVVVSWNEATASCMQLSEAGKRSLGLRRKHTDWSTVVANEALRRGGRSSWRLKVEHVSRTGDVVVGIKVGPSHDGDAFCYVPVGSSNWCGCRGVNAGCADFGGAGTNYMRWKEPGFSQVMSQEEGVGMDVLVLWREDSLSFHINGQDLGVAYHVGDGNGDLPAVGDLYPFLTTYGRGTAVLLESPIEFDSV